MHIYMKSTLRTSLEKPDLAPAFIRCVGIRETEGNFDDIQLLAYVRFIGYESATLDDVNEARLSLRLAPGIYDFYRDL